MAALSAWATAVGRLVPAEPSCLEKADGSPPPPGVTAECTGLHTAASREVWRKLKALGPLAQEHEYVKTAPLDVVKEFQADWDRGADPHGWHALEAPSDRRSNHPQLRKGTCSTCYRKWLGCLCAAPLGSQHHFRPTPLGPDSHGAWACRKCGLSGRAPQMAAAAATFCPGVVPTARRHDGWWLFALPPDARMACSGGVGGDSAPSVPTP